MYAAMNKVGHLLRYMEHRGVYLYLLSTRGGPSEGHREMVRGIQLSFGGVGGARTSIEQSGSLERIKGDL